jgi:hypothetical protein
MKVRRLYFSFMALAILMLAAVVSVPATVARAAPVTNTSGAFAFSPPTYVDYKRLGGEPTTTVDRYPSNGAPDCRPQTTCYRDYTYVSAPQGVVFPHTSLLWKSSDRGQTFRLTAHVPGHGINVGSGGGGGDSHQMVGEVDHKVFYVDLSGLCVTMNTSTDRGETWVNDQFGCGANPGGIDDRQWVDVDQHATAPIGTTGNVYVSFNNFTNAALPTIAMARSTHNGLPGSFITDSSCDFLTNNVGGPDSTPTPCPDPLDSRLQLSGPIVVDKSPTSPYFNSLYIPFVRGGPAITGSVAPNPPYELWIATSRDFGNTWTRHLVSDRGFHNPINIFPRLTVDKAGIVYITWSETSGNFGDTSTLGGSTRIMYTYSTVGGDNRNPSDPLGGCPAPPQTPPPPPQDLTCTSNTWHGPYQISPNGKTAVMPWFQAGDRGRVDAVWYQSNSSANPNLAPPMTEWNVEFAQSLSATNSGSWRGQFVNTHPNHYGQVCTNGVACSTGGDRRLLDFFTVDIDHVGAAETTWTDDNNGRNDPHQFFVRQTAGPVLFNPPGSIDLRNNWPVHGNSVIDPRGDVYDAAGLPKDACPGMDILGMTVSRAGTTTGDLTVRLTVNGPPTAANAMACSSLPGLYEKGIWAAEFWAPFSAGVQCPGDGPDCYSGDNFYMARRDPPAVGLPASTPSTTGDGEAGRVNDFNNFLTSTELHPEIQARETVTPASCLVSGSTDRVCTITITANFSTLGVANCANLDSVTGLSLYYSGTEQEIPLTRVQIQGNSEQADATAALLFQGCNGGTSGGGGGGGGCHEGDGNGSVHSQGGGSANFESDQDSCEDRDQDHERISDPGVREDFHSTQIQSVQFDDVAGAMTVYGLGESNGLPSTFLIVEQAATAATPASYAIQLSDGYVNTGNLLSGAITLK